MRIAGLIEMTRYLSGGLAEGGCVTEWLAGFLRGLVWLAGAGMVWVLRGLVWLAGAGMVWFGSGLVGSSIEEGSVSPNLSESSLQVYKMVK